MVTIQSGNIRNHVSKETITYDEEPIFELHSWQPLPVQDFASRVIFWAEQANWANEKLDIQLFLQNNGSTVVTFGVPRECEEELNASVLEAATALGVSVPPAQQPILYRRELLLLATKHKVIAFERSNN